MSGPARSSFKASLAAGDGPSLGTWVKLPIVESIELIALAGFDFVVIDLEHSPMNLESAYQLIGTATFRGVSPIVRIPGLEGGFVQRILDSGAEGIMLPHVDSVEHAEAAVQSVRFPPRGQRGVGATSRAGAWGALPRSEYLRFGQEEVVLIAQIESGEGVRAAGEIAAVDGVDALFIGAADLSASEGRAESDPELLSMVADAVAASKRAGVPIGNSGGASTASVQQAVDAGFAFTMLSNDASLLGTAAAAAVSAGRSVRFPAEAH
jgi:2-keto-3-deoxy-L-rhamnonate aldolase RhmA